MMLQEKPSEDPISIMNPLEIRHAGAKGRGVFALRAFKKGELIERCPVLVVPIAEKDLIDKSSLYYYYYAWEPDDDGMAFMLGYGSIYNHSFKPNAIFERNMASGYMDYIAIKDIAPDQEITVNYNGEPDDQEELPYLTVEE